MGCFGVLFALLVPRITMLVIAISTDWFNLAYETVFWPVVGWIFMPYTTLAVMGSRLNGGGLGWFILIIIAIIADLSSDSGGANEVKIR